MADQEHREMKNLIDYWQDGRDYVGDDDFIADETKHFAVACFDTHFDETLLIVDSEMVADKIDCDVWNLSPSEWAFQLGMAHRAIQNERESK